MLQLGGAAGSLMSRRRGMVGRGNKTPMVSVTNVDPDRVANCSWRPARTSGPCFRRCCRSVTAGARRHHRHAGATRSNSSSTAARSPKREEPNARTSSAAARSSAPSSTASRSRSASTPRGWPGVDLVDGWAAHAASTPDSHTNLPSRCSSGRRLGRGDRAAPRGPAPSGLSTWAPRHRHPADRADRPRSGCRPRPRGHPGGQRNLFTVGAEPEVPPPWSSYAPTTREAARRFSEAVHQVHPADRAVADPARRDDADDRRRKDRRRGGQRGPLGRAGRRRAGHRGDLRRRIGELTTLLEPGRAVQFNTLFLDPYLWKLQVGGKRLVQKARQSGAPIDGVVSARASPTSRTRSS